MAQRFGGKYSPTGTGAAPEAKRSLGGREIAFKPPTPPRHPLHQRPFWITLAATPFLLGAFGDGPVVLARSLLAFAVIVGASWLFREGLQAEIAYDSRRVARRPAIPRKIFGSVLFGIGIAIGAQAPEMGMIGAVIAGVIGTGLALLAFGLDPMKDKGMEGIDTFQQDRVARVVTEGEKHLAAIRDAIGRARDRRLEARVERFIATARDLFRVVEEDPGDLSAARRYMGVYLEGARDATLRFVDLWTRTQDDEARSDYEALLDDLEENFTARTRSLIENGREGLEIEIEVLRERLDREGVRKI